MNSERDTLPPGVDERSPVEPMLLTEERFKAILREMVVDELMGLREDVRAMREELARLQHRVTSHDYDLDDMRRQIRDHDIRLAALESKNGTPT